MSDIEYGSRADERWHVDEVLRGNELAERRRFRRYAGKRGIGERFAELRDRVEMQFLRHYFQHVPSWRLWLRGRDTTRVMPDFFVIGPIKSGSTELASYVMQHPCVTVPLAKEIRRPVSEWPKFYPTRREVEAIRGRYGVVRSGHFGPWLSHVPMLEMAYECCSTAKTVMLLRDPVARAYSHWKWDILNGARGMGWTLYDRYRDFEKDMERSTAVFPDMIDPWGYGGPLLHEGLYAMAVRRWVERFGKDRVMVLEAEEFFENPDAVLRKIWAFLELPPFAIRKHRSMNQNAGDFPPMTPRSAEILTRFYESDVTKLSEHLGRGFWWRKLGASGERA